MAEVRLIELKISGWIWKIFPPVLIVFGVTGNILSVFILTRPRIIKSSTGVLLLGLAFVDLIILAVILPRQWINYTFHMDIRHITALLCKGHVFFTYTCFHLASWFLVAVTLERVISVLYPHKVRVVCTKRRAVCTIFMLVLCSSILNSHCLFEFELTFSENLNTTICRPSLEHEDFFFHIWPWVDLAVGFLLPFSTLFLGNLVIVKTVYSNKRQNNDEVKRKGRIALRRSISSESKRNISTSSVFLRLMFALNVSYVFSNLPLTVVTIGQVFWWTEDSMTDHRLAQLELVWSLVNLLLYTNSGINFLLYIMSGNKFRRDLRHLCCRRSGRFERSRTGSSKMSHNSRSGHGSAVV